MRERTTHKSNIVALKRIEGQIKGIQGMIEEEKYCVDIITQIHAAISALHRVAEKILAKHIEHCVVAAFRGRSEIERVNKIHEIMDLIKRLHKLR